MSDRLTPEREAEITARTKAATRGPWTLAYEYCDCSEDCGHGRYVSRINTGAGPATELVDLPMADWELMVHARADIDALLAELSVLRAENAELGQEAAKLAALEAYGVDNWEGYDDALAGVREAIAEGAAS